MIVDKIGAAVVPATPARPGVGGFNVPTAGSEPGRMAPTATLQASSLDAMLALQERYGAAQHGPVRDREARRRGQGLLAALAALQAAVLAQGDPAEALAQLTALSSGPAADDPQLESILGAVSLRAAIELARHGR